jgi:DNA-binding transcriptional MocR family regulator
VTLPDYLDAAELLKEALKQKVAYVPGASFYPDGSGKNTLRMNFSFCNPETINTGIERLGEVFSQVIESHEVMAGNGLNKIRQEAF